MALLVRPTPPAEIAWRLDRAAGGEERFLSALELAAAGDGGPFAAAVCRDALRVARQAEPARVLPRARVGYRWGIALSMASAALLFASPPRLYDAPEAAFTATPARGPAPLGVTFEDASVGAIDEFAWEFGDGAPGRGERVNHVYERPGRYTAHLRLRGPGGRSKASREIDVLPPDRATAEFEANPSKGRAPLQVRFTNLSRNAKTYEWDFGDGVHSSEEGPSHTYGTPGLYTVRLRALNDIGVDERVRERYVKVAHPDEPLADFRAYPVEGDAPLPVDFEDASTGVAREWEWDFGDIYAGEGRRSAERNPAHLYTVPGYYTVRLRVKGPHGEDEEEKVRFIRVRQEGGGQGKGGGPGGGPEGKGGAGGDRPGSPDRRPGRLEGERARRPDIGIDPVIVPPHTQGGDLREDIKVFANPGGGSGTPGEVPLGTVFREYERAYEDSISREHIPPAMRGVVQRYYEKIRPR
jgi:PKD repeat protein